MAHIPVESGRIKDVLARDRRALYCLRATAKTLADVEAALAAVFNRNAEDAAPKKFAAGVVSDWNGATVTELHAQRE